ncbi:MAG TPA: hypothetical protein VFX51_00915 [Solirubrobacteraceae bacterium]|nr:hypothetical protein [Solirubrobacteraceae bacterium]
MPRPEHLALIQGVITRMAGNSFLIKGWTVTLVAGLSALAADKSDGAFGWLAVAVALVFAFLDAFYLALERAYRRLYADVAAERNTDPWTLNAGKVGPGDVLQGLTGFAVWPLHGAALAGALIVAFSA